MTYLPFRTGSTTLVSGVAFVTDTLVTANSKVFVTDTGSVTNIGSLSVLIGAGAGFTITSTNLLDGSTVPYLVI